MQSKKDRRQEDLSDASPLGDLVPDDHILKQVDGILDLLWFHDEVRGRYCRTSPAHSIGDLAEIADFLLVEAWSEH